MPTLNVKKERVYELARHRAGATGTSMTSLIESALQEKLDRLSRHQTADTRARLAELDADRYRQAIVSHEVKTSAASYLEASIVLDRRGSTDLSAELDRFLSWARATIEPVSATQARIARRAYQQFGRRSGHPARLNLGEFISDALAKETAEPLPFKGTDFAHTDVLAAV